MKSPKCDPREFHLFENYVIEVCRSIKYGIGGVVNHDDRVKSRMTQNETMGIRSKKRGHHSLFLIRKSKLYNSYLLLR